MEFKNNNDILTFGRDLTDAARKNQLDPIIGRDEEIRRLIEIISRKNKNNPVLIGEAGVGKTAIVEGFAQRIVNNDVPDNLRDKRVIELNLSQLISGASYQGQFEERLNNVVKQIKESHGEIILFIDEIHQLVGTGRAGGSNMDAANILKPMLARGEIKLIGATTLNEYRQYIEKDAALERRMQKIIVNEPSKQETLTIMRGLKPRWEMFHKVKIHDAALIMAVNLSDRYINDRFLPDKAIDLIDEAAAKIKTQMHSCPAELDQVNRQIMHLETEKAALSGENDPKSKKHLDAVEAEINSLKSKQNQFMAEWQKQKEQNQRLNDLKIELDETKASVERLQMEGSFEKASKALYVTIPELEKQIKKAEAERANNQNMVPDAVGPEEVAEVISAATKIPLNKLMEKEQQKLLHLGDELAKRVKGQKEAIDLVSSAVLRSRVGINDPNRPIGSFLFMGPTGVGKTELSKALAFSLFDNEKAMIRFDMSEYMEKHSVAKLIGSPPGYVGFEQGGLLTEAIRRKPYAVLLFDEIEKAHPDVLNVLLQVLDDGQLKDAHGHLVNFKNTIIIMTSNIGGEALLDGKKDEAIKQLQKTLKPEFINRIDEIVTFNPLSDKDLVEIIKNQMQMLHDRLKANDYNVVFDDSIVEYVKKGSYNPQYGARPIKRFIQHHLENYIAEQIVSNHIDKQQRYTLVYKVNKLEIKKSN